MRAEAPSNLGLLEWQMALHYSCAVAVRVRRSGCPEHKNKKSQSWRRWRSRRRRSVSRWVRPVPARVERQVLVQRRVVVVEQLLFQTHIKKGKEEWRNQTAGRVPAAPPGLAAKEVHSAIGDVTFNIDLEVDMGLCFPLLTWSCCTLNYI